jgi:aryl-alcohol dehydrogenase-like predicted oxidoreductase
VHAAVREYVRVAAEAGVTPAQLAYGFCRSRWFVPSTLVGASSVAQLRENLGAFSAELPPEVLAAIDEVHVRHRNASLVD